MHFVMAAEISGTIKNSGLERALVILQKRHPLLSAFVDPNDYNQPLFRKLLGRVIPLRHIENDGDLEKEMAREMATPFNAENDMPARMVLISGEEISKLILVVEHVIGDGMSGFICLMICCYYLAAANAIRYPCLHQLII